MKRATMILSTVLAVVGLAAACNLQPWGYALLLFAIWTACASGAWDASRK